MFKMLEFNQPSRISTEPKNLLFQFSLLEFYKDGSDCFCGYRSSYKAGKRAAITDMCHLETDNQPEAKARDTDQEIIYRVNHSSSPIS
jgi:hypothetical protein